MHGALFFWIFFNSAQKQSMQLISQPNKWSPRFTSQLRFLPYFVKHDENFSNLFETLTNDEKNILSKKKHLGKIWENNKHWGILVLFSKRAYLAPNLLRFCFFSTFLNFPMAPFITFSTKRREN